jgi:hypothetical protein
MSQSEDGKKIKVSLLGGRRMDSNQNPVVFFFPPRLLRAAAAAIDTTNINMYMDLYAAENYLIVECEERDFHAQTIIAMLPNPNRVNKPVLMECGGSFGYRRDAPKRLPRAGGA